jgi:hypothetical protein
MHALNTGDVVVGIASPPTCFVPLVRRPELRSNPIGPGPAQSGVRRSGLWAGRLARLPHTRGAARWLRSVMTSGPSEWKGSTS